MDGKRFWDLIDSSRTEAEGDPDAQADTLKRRLLELNPESIVVFDRIFAERLNESYRWDLWAAAYIVNGGCSDDCFDYFRMWLIAQGKAAYERVLTDPERVGELLSPGDDADGELLGYAAADAYEELTGKPLPASQIERKTEPSGTEWDEESVEKVYPRLAERFDY